MHEIVNTFVYLNFLLFQWEINLELFPQELGERWTAVCRWTEERWIKLQDINSFWQELLEEQVKLIYLFSLHFLHSNALKSLNKFCLNTYFTKYSL